MKEKFAWEEKLSIKLCKTKAEHNVKGNRTRWSMEFTTTTNELNKIQWISESENHGKARKKCVWYKKKAIITYNHDMCVCVWAYRHGKRSERCEQSVDIDDKKNMYGMAWYYQNLQPCFRSSSTTHDRFLCCCCCCSQLWQT